ncbi:MAG: iron-containing alcohol dehydrogenase, partial [Lachnospiraceae bacterium]
AALEQSTKKCYDVVKLIRIYPTGYRSLLTLRLVQKSGAGQVEGIWADVCTIEYNRVIAIGGGTIIDVAKLFALRNVSPVVDLFENKLEIIREKELILVPTTCGTGSEVTNVSILELTTRNTKFGLAVPELYANEAVLIPELLYDLPFRYFATSSIDAFIHAIESYTSVRATPFTKMYSILKAYKNIAQNGEEARRPLLKDVQLASTYAGIAFGNAGTAAVHAMSYPLSAAYHVPHGEANYALLTEVYRKYMEKAPHGESLLEVNAFLGNILGCEPQNVYEEIEKLFQHILEKKPLHTYGVRETELADFTKVVIEKQGRLTRNNYVPLTAEDYMDIYKKQF